MGANYVFYLKKANLRYMLNNIIYKHKGSSRYNIFVQEDPK